MRDGFRTRTNVAVHGNSLDPLVAIGAASDSAQTAPPATPLKFDDARSYSILLKQCAFGPRKPGTDAHKACRDYILEETKKYCDAPRLQPFTHVWSSTNAPINMWNIIGEQNWNDAKVRVALFAHWDTRPTADQDPNPLNRSKPILGANDGASGVAVLLELMRVLKDQHPGVGIQFVFVDGEDLGPGLDEMFLGAVAYAEAMPNPRPDYGILLDMIGDKDLRVPREPNSVQFAPDLVKKLFLHASSVGLSDAFPYVYGPTIEDDHIPLNQAGQPTIDLIDFDYRPWHTLADTPDKCSAASLGKVGKLLQTWLTKSPPYMPPGK